MSSSKLDLIFKRNTIGGSGRVDVKTAKQQIKSLFLSIVGEDEPETVTRVNGETTQVVNMNGAIVRNAERAKLRKSIKEL